jgi:hypothetical protein
MTEREEAIKILDLYGGDGARAFDLLDKNYSVLQTRGHILMSLCGVVVTVSGFSGRMIAGTHLSAQVLIVCGLAAVIFSAFWLFNKVMRIRWLSQCLDKELVSALEEGIRERNIKQRHYWFAGIVFCVGVALYAGAFFIMLLNPFAESLPPR